MGSRRTTRLSATLGHKVAEREEPALEPMAAREGTLQYEHDTASGADAIAAAGAATAVATAPALATAPAPQPQGQVVNEHKDLGRNDPCWCGSGKKFKRCHGA